MSKRIVYFVARGFLYLLFSSCKNDIHYKDRVADKKYQFQLHFKVGTKYYYYINAETKTSFSVNNKGVETLNQSETGLIYEVTKDSADLYWIDITYDQLHVHVKNQNGEQDVDIANAVHSVNPLEKALASLKGAVINLVIKKNGEIVKVDGAQEITNRLLTALHTQDDYTKKLIQEQLNKLAGEEFVKNNLAQIFKLFPDSAVNVGDTSKRKEATSDQLQADALTTYTLTSISDNTAEVEAESTINSTSETTSMGVETKANLEGKQKGDFETDTKTGLMLKGRITSTVEGTFELMGREVPVTMHITKDITAKKI